MLKIVYTVKDFVRGISTYLELLLKKKTNMIMYLSKWVLFILIFCTEYSKKLDKMFLSPSPSLIPLPMGLH